MGLVIRLVSEAIPRINFITLAPPVLPASILLDSNSQMLNDSNSQLLEDNSTSSPPVYTKTLVAYNYVIGNIGNLYKIGLAVLHNDGTYHFDHPTIIQNSPSAGWKGNHVKDPYLIKVGARIWCYYSGSSTASYDYSIGVSYSDDNGITWVEYAGNPILTQTQAWETAVGNSSVLFPVILYEPTDPDPNKRWKMWYAGDTNGYGIGYATAPDGVTWTKFVGNPLLTLGVAGQWDDSPGLVPRGILKVGLTYHLFYGASDGANAAFGYATFNNPEGAYNKSADNPLVIFDGITTTITANVVAGNTNIAVTDSSVFPDGCLVWVYDVTPMYFLTRVLSKPDATHIIIEDSAPIAILAATGLVRSITYSGVGAPFVEYDGAVFTFHSFGFLPGLLPAGGLKEIAMQVTGAVLSTLTIDYAALPLVFPRLWQRTNWTHISMKNISKITFNL